MSEGKFGLDGRMMGSSGAHRGSSCLDSLDSYNIAMLVGFQGCVTTKNANNKRCDASTPSLIGYRNLLPLCSQWQSKSSLRVVVVEAAATSSRT